MEGVVGRKIRRLCLNRRRSEPRANALGSISGILPILSILSKLPVFETSGWMRAIRRQDEQDLRDGGGRGTEDPTLVSEPQAI